MKDTSSEFFYLKLWKKRTRRSETLKLLGRWVEINQISCVMFETKSQFFFKLRITLQCHET